MYSTCDSCRKHGGQVVHPTSDVKTEIIGFKRAVLKGRDLAMSTLKGLDSSGMEYEGEKRKTT
eukprot:971376-Pelagomonas_calceolata.AAC.1